MRLSMEEVQKQHESTKKLYEQGLTVAPVDVKRVLDLYDTIEALQQENEQLRAKLEDWKHEVKCHMDEVIAREKQIEQLQAQAARMWEALRKAREVLYNLRMDDYPGFSAICEALTAIDKVIGGKEDE